MRGVKIGSASLSGSGGVLSVTGKSERGALRTGGLEIQDPEHLQNESPSHSKCQQGPN